MSWRGVHYVTRSGEAGIGKSQLTAAQLERLGGEPHTRLRYFCSPQHTDSALFPIIGQMERAAKLMHGDTLASALVLRLPQSGRHSLVHYSRRYRLLWGTLDSSIR